MGTDFLSNNGWLFGNNGANLWIIASWIMTISVLGTGIVLGYMLHANPDRFDEPWYVVMPFSMIVAMMLGYILGAGFWFLLPCALVVVLCYGCGKLIFHIKQKVWCS